MTNSIEGEERRTLDRYRQLKISLIVKIPRLTTVTSHQVLRYQLHARKLVLRQPQAAFVYAYTPCTSDTVSFTFANNSFLSPDAIKLKAIAQRHCTDNSTSVSFLFLNRRDYYHVPFACLARRPS